MSQKSGSMEDKNSNERIKDGVFRDGKDLADYLRQKASRHSHFKFYSGYRAIESICDRDCIFLSDGKNWNDPIDCQNMQNDENFYNFGICFSFSVSENVAMWLLYSKDDGCMIDFDKDSISQMMSVKSVELGVFGDNREFVPNQVLSVKDDGIRIQLVDMVYYGEPEDDEHRSRDYYVRRSRETNKLFDRRVLDGCRLYSKQLPWSYENECRLIVSVPRKALDDDKSGLYLKIEFDKSIIPKLRKEKRIYNSPNASNVNEDPLYSKNTKSKLSGRINWKLKKQLCDDCELKKQKDKGNQQ